MVNSRDRVQLRSFFSDLTIAAIAPFALLSLAVRFPYALFTCNFLPVPVLLFARARPVSLGAQNAKPRNLAQH